MKKLFWIILLSFASASCTFNGDIPSRLLVGDAVDLGGGDENRLDTPPDVVEDEEEMDSHDLNDPRIDPDLIPDREETEEDAVDDDPNTDSVENEEEEATEDPIPDPVMDKDVVEEITEDYSVDPLEDPIPDPTIDPMEDIEEEVVEDPTFDPVEDFLEDLVLDPTEEDMVEDAVEDPILDPAEDSTEDQILDLMEDEAVEDVSEEEVVECIPSGHDECETGQEGVDDDCDGLIDEGYEWIYPPGGETRWSQPCENNMYRDDAETGLRWRVSISRMTWTDAIDWCQTYVGEEWRLPSMDELWTILLADEGNRLSLLTEIFGYAAIRQFWSSDEVLATTLAWVLDFSTIEEFQAEKRLQYYIRCVTESP